jgi:hypothetical protein
MYPTDHFPKYCSCIGNLDLVAKPIVLSQATSSLVAERFERWMQKMDSVGKKRS